MKRVSSCIFVRRRWYGDLVLFPFPLQSHWKASKEPKQDLYNDVFFCPHFFFSTRGKNQILLGCKKQKFCFWIFFLSSYNHFLSHNDHLHSIVNFYKPFHVHPRNIVLPQIADTFKKLPKVTLKNPPFRSVHIDLTFAQLFFSRQKSLGQINTKRKKSQRQPECLQHFWRGVQWHFSFFSKEEVFFTMEWRVKPTKWRMAGTFRKTSLL